MELTNLELVAGQLASYIPTARSFHRILAAEAQ